jgi:hypothetical protein
MDILTEKFEISEKLTLDLHDMMPRVNIFLLHEWHARKAYERREGEKFKMGEACSYLRAEVPGRLQRLKLRLKAFMRCINAEACPTTAE